MHPCLGMSQWYKNVSCQNAVHRRESSEEPIITNMHLNFHQSGDRDIGF